MFDFQSCPGIFEPFNQTVHKKKIQMLYFNWQKLLFIPVAFFLFISASISQASGEIERTIEFNGDDALETMIIEVDPGVASLGVVLSGQIKTGSLVVSIVDPKGKKRNAFSLDCDQSVGGNYEVRSISDGAVVSVVKGEKGKSHVIAETKEGRKSVIITSEGDGSSSVMQIVTGPDTGKAEGIVRVEGKPLNEYGNSVSDSAEGRKGVVVTSNNEAGAKGVFVDSIDDPKPGNWKVVCEGKKVKGKVDVVINKGSS